MGRLLTPSMDGAHQLRYVDQRTGHRARWFRKSTKHLGWLGDRARMEATQKSAYQAAPRESTLRHWLSGRQIGRAWLSRLTRVERLP